MDQEHFQTLKEHYLDMITKIISDTGSLSPSFTVLGKDRTDGKTALCLVPIEPKFMKDEESKDYFIDVVVPEISEKIQEMFEIHAVGWAAEAWMRVAKAEDTSIQQLKKDWKNLPVKAEVVIVTIDSDEHKETTIKEIVRKGKQVNADGELIDHVELKDMPGYTEMPSHAAEGRFTDLYKKFTKKP